MGVQIAPQSLAEILSMLAPKAARGLGAEKRKATRIRIEGQVTIWPVKGGSPGTATTALTRDLSYSGVGLLVGNKVEGGAQFILKLPRLKDDPLMVLCQVTFMSELAENIFVVGAEFVSQLEKPKESGSKRFPVGKGENAAASN